MSDDDRQQLRKIAEDAAAARAAAEQAVEQGRITNGRLLEVEQTLHGPQDRSGRRMGGGLVDQLHDHKRSTRKGLDMLRERINSVSFSATGFTSAENAKKDTWMLAIRVAGLVVAALACAATIWAVAS